MAKAYFYCLVDPTSDKPRCAGLMIDDQLTIYELYRPGAGKTIKDISLAKREITTKLLQLNDQLTPLITNNFKQTIRHFNLPLDGREYEAYDVHYDMSNKVKVGSQNRDHQVINATIANFTRRQEKPYQKILANAAVAYQSMENRGIVINDEPMFPIWTMDVFSGRTKATKFPLQGHDGNDIIQVTGSSYKTVLMHFDWIAADIRVAALMSGDKKLIDSFDYGDPYKSMMDRINDEAIGEERITRQDCKDLLLKSINRMDIGSQALRIYPDLVKWIRQCQAQIKKTGRLSSMLDRVFKLEEGRNELAIINAVMQGSVAHAMHRSIYRIWLKFGHFLLADIHDSIVLCVPNEPGMVRAVADAVVSIMLRPFTELLDDDPVFPVRLSIGSRWQKWEPIETHNSKGVIKIRARIKQTAGV